MTAAPQTAPDPKRTRILDGAMKVFLAYGYSRVTMDDIARAAEVSRPALYLLFKNKAEIYRAIGAMLLDASAQAGRAALAADGPFAERMMAAIECSLIAMMKTITDSPHGAEILDMKNSLASDLTAVWRDALRQSIEPHTFQTPAGLPEHAFGCAGGRTLRDIGPGTREVVLRSAA